MREIKFRAWDKSREQMINVDMLLNTPSGMQQYRVARPLINGVLDLEFIKEDSILMQYTGLKDKNDVEIYEHMELDNQFEVSFNQGSYILTNISNGDIMTLHKYIKDKNGQVKITREYTKI